MYRQIAFFILAALTAVASWAQSVATCQNPEGYAYFHFSGLVPSEKSGFVQDQITGGLVTLQKVGPRKYDLLFVDASKRIISATGDGGIVTLVRKGSQDATFIHFYPGRVLEVYTFWVDSKGQSKYDILQSKGGDFMPIHKSSVMVGTCANIDFDLIE